VPSTSTIRGQTNGRFERIRSLPLSLGEGFQIAARAALKSDPIKGPGAGRRGLFLFKEEIAFMLFSRHPCGDCRKAQTLIVKQRVGAKIGVCRA